MERVKVVLACSECLKHNYTVTKNKTAQPTRLEYKKFCAACTKHTLHKESR